MDFNPAHVDLRKHLAGANYPASGEELASAARSNDAPSALVEELRNLTTEKLSSPDEVRAALVRESAGRERARFQRRHPS